MAEKKPKRLALVASQGTLDWAYPPFILASTAVAMGMEVAIFFTFYGLTLLQKNLTAKISPQSNPAMPMKLPFGPEAIQKMSISLPNMLMGNLPGFESAATTLMKKKFAKEGVATIEELRTMCLESGVRMIGCTMTMGVFGFTPDTFIDGIESGGAATFLDFAADADISLFI